MLRGIYTAASGMLAQAMRSDVLANNLANVDTPGYRRQATQIEAFPTQFLMREEKRRYTPIGTLGTGSLVTGVRNSFLPGRIQTTSNPLDVALAGHGFFVIDTPGQRSYTRDGSFTINVGGWLVTQDGFRVLGENGPIYIGDSKEIVIDSEGVVTVDGQVRDRLLVVEFLDRTGLANQGGNRFIATAAAGLPIRYRSTVIQGSLEMANVNTVREMVNLIEVQRAYESNQRVIQAFDDTLGKLINVIGT
ncbi:MAG: flagellar basal-body rod protein FlgF [Firmicutes bacterium]|nr:flagellar basal-body rod protein FlgF [Bacillota bacterium]NLL87938.1 flagellar basal-body rod protein FlgF [Bacillota bacterium]HKM17687.1 flagellar basal-body rod protein FlgF [Limnochordia bacterium]